MPTNQLAGTYLIDMIIAKKQYTEAGTEGRQERAREVQVNPPVLFFLSPLFFFFFEAGLAGAHTGWWALAASQLVYIPNPYEITGLLLRLAMAAPI